jgi:small subunit ribosomal protein S16
VAVKIKLMRLGKIRQPYYRIVVADSRTRRNGKAIETIGKYHPKAEPSLIEVDSDRAQYWLGVGAQPTDPVQRILEVTGDWQRFKGLPGADGTLKVGKPKPSKQDLFNAALAEAGSEPITEATTPKRRTGARKPDEAKAEPKAESKAEPKADAKSDARNDAKGRARKGDDAEAASPSGEGSEPA